MEGKRSEAMRLMSVLFEYASKGNGWEGGLIINPHFNSIHPLFGGEQKPR